MPHKFNHTRFYLIALIVLLPLFQGCFIGNKLGQANKAYELGEYSRAIKQYKNAYKKEKNRYKKGELAFYLGECYRKTNNPRKAAGFYSKSVRYKYEEQEADLYLADMYLAAGKYEEALEAYLAYQERNSLDQRGRNGVSSCKLATNDSITTRYEVLKHKELSNTRSSDFCPGYASAEYDMVYFSSMRTEKKSRKKSRITGQGGSNLYMARIDGKGKWTDPVPLADGVNSEFDDGSGTMSSDGKAMLFTRCKYDDKKPMGAEMMMVSRTGGKWGEPTPIEIQGDSSILVAHPALSPDGNTLFFVSDMEGSVGGKDIWKVESSGDMGWGKPVNMGNVINTAGDELFPYVRMDGTLYFSSNAHVGYGGLDIYRTTKDEDGNYKVINMGRPINSFGDDFGIAFKGMQEEGLFSSSRGSSKGIDNIWSFVLPKLEFGMKGDVRNQNTGNPISDAYLKLIGTDGTNVKLNVREDGTFGAKLTQGTDYVFMVASKGFFNHKEKMSTIALSDNTEFEFNVEMMPIEDAIILKNIYFEEGKALLNNDSKKELDRLLTILNTNQGVVLEIGAHTSGEGDETQSVILSQKRAQAVMDYLLANGIATERLSAKGYGDSQPLLIDRRLASENEFLKAGDVLTKEFISSQRGSNKKKAERVNRRIEFRIKK